MRKLDGLKMQICIDFDGTYTRDPIFWDEVILLAKKYGHDVICATMRYEENEGDTVREFLDDKVSNIYFTDRRAKQVSLASIGVKPDIWIEDCPMWLLTDAL